MKFSLFVEGGAYNTIFSYGAICALIKILNDNELNIFNSIVANSSSLGFMTYFFSKELNTKGKKVMLELCDDKNILDSKKINRLFYGKKPYFDIGYLVHTLSTKKQIIPNYDEIKKNIERLLIPILNVQTLQTEYISFNNDNFNESTYKLYLEAAMAMPILYDKYVEVNKKKYVDGALKDVFQIEHKKLKNS